MYLRYRVPSYALSSSSSPPLSGSKDHAKGTKKRQRAAGSWVTARRSVFLLPDRRFFMQHNPQRILLGLILAVCCMVIHYPSLYQCPWIPQYQRPPPTIERSFEALREQVQKQRRYTYTPMDTGATIECPEEVPGDYPREFPILQVLDNWPIDYDTLREDELSMPSRMIYQGICAIDYAKFDDFRVARDRIRRYQAAEIPFVVRNDPAALETAVRWQQEEPKKEHSTTSYLHWLLQGRVFRTEFSRTPVMLYWNRLWSWKRAASVKEDDPNNVDDTITHGPSLALRQTFQEPTSIRPLSFARWDAMARQISKQSIKQQQPYAYLRADACLRAHLTNCTAAHRYPLGVCPHGWAFWAKLSDADFLYDELPFFHPYDAKSYAYNIDAHRQHGIQCRFGAAGLTAVNHFDNARNWIAVLQGERRYILSHPKNCQSMALYPIDHPLERHSKVDWAAPNLTEFPKFSDTTVNEVVLQAGDLLYLPTYWFHHIVSLNYNIQCNTRSGYSLHYDGHIDACGFLYPLPE